MKNTKQPNPRRKKNVFSEVPLSHFLAVLRLHPYFIRLGCYYVRKLRWWHRDRPQMMTAKACEKPMNFAGKCFWKKAFQPSTRVRNPLQKTSSRRTGKSCLPPHWNKKRAPPTSGSHSRSIGAPRTQSPDTCPNSSKPEMTRRRPSENSPQR